MLVALAILLLLLALPPPSLLLGVLAPLREGLVSPPSLAACCRLAANAPDLSEVVDTV